MTIDGRESHMFISDGLAYLPSRCSADKEMELYPKVPLTPSREWNPSDIDDDVQWDDSNGNASFGANVYATSYT